MMLHVEHVSFGWPALRRDGTHGSRSDKMTWVLQNISFTVGEGQFVCILGPQGSGKQVLLDIMAGFVAPTSGTVRVDGVRVREPGPDRAVVFRRCTLFPWLTLADNVAFGLQCQGMSAGNARAVAIGHLRNVGLADFATAYPQQLSEAMRKRAAIARVWALGSPIVLMDDPFAVVEEELRPRLREQLLDLWRESGKTIVFITENADEAADLGQRVMVLTPHPGRISADVYGSDRVLDPFAPASGLYVAEEAAGVDSEQPHTQAPHTRAPHTQAPHTQAPHTEASHAQAPHTLTPHTRPDSTEPGVRARENFRQAVREAFARAAGTVPSSGSGLRGDLPLVRFDVKT